MKKRLKAILFDLDDTLFLEKDFVKSGFKAVASYIHNKNGIDEKMVTVKRICSQFLSISSKSLFLPSSLFVLLFVR